MGEIEVPSHFLCPISMELMRDPVTAVTGITYDRESIEKWLFSGKNTTCPVTKQDLSDTDLTPNHTLRRLIQGWCTLHASHGIERIPTPKPPVDKAKVEKLVNDANKFPQMQLECIQRLKSLALESERNRKCLEEAGAIEFLASVIIKNEYPMAVEATSDHESDLPSARDEALSILYHLETSEASRKKLVPSNNGEFMESLVQVLACGRCQSRTDAVLLLKSVFEVADPNQLIGVAPKLFIGITSVLREKISYQTSKAALKLLMEICPWGRNRVKAVEAGAVFALVELLLDAPEKRISELVLVVLDQLCSCAEGRAELVRHAAGVAIVSKKILRVSHLASDRAVKILSSVCRLSACSRVLQEMQQVGVVSKLCLVLQMESSLKTKERAREILKLHSRVWKHSPCIPPRLLSSYPAS
ncbi:E3 ubiquitin-protein ligase PUB23-like [Malania oleifera]|uniref:E3 ubiquitin-protein ligase PUB23-like n=1 Tax=Malania oleifera TaxID=397392 RepID=UPI0025ADB80C|nr:E3 ubiquitin-protein ligase PUB23-like [Malania oleifera]